MLYKFIKGNLKKKKVEFKFAFLFLKGKFCFEEGKATDFLEQTSRTKCYNFQGLLD